MMARLVGLESLYHGIGNVSVLRAYCEVDPVTGIYPHKGPVM